MSEDKAEIKLKNLILKNAMFNLILGMIGGVSAIATELVFSSAMDKQHLWLTIAVPPLIFLFVDLLFKFSMFDQDFNLKQKQQKANNVLVMFRCVFLLLVIMTGTVLFMFNANLNAELREGLIGYLLICCSGTLVMTI